MYFQCDSPLEPLRVLIINSKSPAAKFLAVKILSGEIFGRNQLIDVVLMVFSHDSYDQSKARGLKFELEKCAFACTNSINVSTSFPSSLIKWTVNWTWTETSTITLLVSRPGPAYRPPDQTATNIWEKLFEVVPKNETIKEVCSRLFSKRVSFIFKVISDGDVFCLLTNFDNPNMLDFIKTYNAQEWNKQTDMLDLIANIAYNLQGPLQEDHADETAQEHELHKRKQIIPEKKARKPIIVTDGLVSLHIIMSISKNLPSDIFFCPTPIAGIAKSVLGEHLKVQRKVLNNALVWAANDEIFHVEFEKPLIVGDGDKVSEESPCDRETVGKDVLVSTNLDHTQFNSSWLKKDLIAKTGAISRKNPCGNIYKAASVAKTLQEIWSTRLTNEKLYTNMGVVSDGSLETIKGYPYVLPIVLNGDMWGVNQRYKEDAHLKLEIKRINKAVKSLHEKLLPFCKLLMESGSSSWLSVEEESQEGRV